MHVFTAYRRPLAVALTTLATLGVAATASAAPSPATPAAAAASCASLQAQYRGVQAEIDMWQQILQYASTPEKPGIVAEIRALQRQASVLRQKLRAAGCAIPT
jgi:hypothetical protein